MSICSFSLSVGQCIDRTLPPRVCECLSAILSAAPFSLLQYSTVFVARDGNVVDRQLVSIRSSFHLGLQSNII